MPSLRTRFRAFTARRIFRLRYDQRQALSALSHTLVATRTVGQVVGEARRVLAFTVRPQWVNFGLLGEDGAYRVTDLAEDGRELRMPLARALAAELEQAELLWPTRRRATGEEPSLWARLGADLVVPVRAGGEPLAFLALGPKSPAGRYSAADLAFLRAAAVQIGLALSRGAALERVAKLREDQAWLESTLQRQVEERTAALQTSNAELSRSLDELRRAYKQLADNQTVLLRAERLASLGRLTAGLAHEINTPLGAVLNALKTISNLGEEYTNSIDDSAVLPEDHKAIARDILDNTRLATEWVKKAAAYMRSITSHGREGHKNARSSFRIADALGQVRGLVAHRMRAAGCWLEFSEDPPGLTLFGDAGRFGQVLVNLITNAVDVYEDRGIPDGRIEVRARRRANSISVQMRDWAGGIPAAILPHIFEELYTTKEAGRGTGLGLWIARNLVEQSFDGTLDVVTGHGGSCFTLDFPLHSSVEEQGAASDNGAPSGLLEERLPALHPADGWGAPIAAWPNPNSQDYEPGSARSAAV